MDTTRYDLVIVGGGTAGFAAAHTAERLGARMLMVDDNVVGFAGTCVNVTCIPTKHLLYAAELIYTMQRHQYAGLHSSVSVEFKELINTTRRLIHTQKRWTTESPDRFLTTGQRDYS